MADFIESVTSSTVVDIFKVESMSKWSTRITARYASQSTAAVTVSRSLETRSQSLRIRATLASLLVVLLTIVSGVPASAETPGEVIARAVANPQRSEADRQRDARDKPAAVLSFIGVRPGMKVADVISGGGYYSELMSYVVGPTGKVIAHTVKIYDRWVADERKARFAEGRLPNLVPLSEELPELQLGKESLDLILMVMVYHDIYYKSDFWTPPNRDDFFNRIRTALKPGGILAIVDHAALAGTGNTAAQSLHRIDEAFAKRDIERAGFKFQAESDVLRNPADDHTILAYDPRIQGHTDRFVYRFVKR
jgi:predicted methyltransferase